MAALTEFKVLAFDVYGTIIDWERGLWTALQPLLSQCSSNETTKEKVFGIIHNLEKTQQMKTPGAKYRHILAAIYPGIAEQLGAAKPTDQESKAFGDSVGTWPAFPDSVDALRRLAKHYKLVVVSNTDREAFTGTQTGPLQGTPFDLILLAEDMGCYKPDAKVFGILENQIRDKLGVSKEQILQTAQSQFHDHHPAKKAGIKSCWIVRPGGIMGNQSEEIYDFKFDTLGEMADALEAQQI